MTTTASTDPGLPRARMAAAIGELTMSSATAPPACTRR
jgi:hypothetical protein